MCRNIRTLFSFEPPATELEIRDAALQVVRTGVWVVSSLGQGFMVAGMV